MSDAEGYSGCGRKERRGRLLGYVGDGKRHGRKDLSAVSVSMCVSMCVCVRVRLSPLVFFLPPY